MLCVRYTIRRQEEICRQSRDGNRIYLLRSSRVRLKVGRKEVNSWEAGQWGNSREQLSGDGIPTCLLDNLYAITDLSLARYRRNPPLVYSLFADERSGWLLSVAAFS